MAGSTGSHDVGGLLDDAPIDIHSGDKKYQHWEVQTHCLLTLLAKKGLITVDEVGRCNTKQGRDGVWQQAAELAFSCLVLAEPQRNRGSA